MSSKFSEFGFSALQAELSPESRAALRELTILDVVDSTNLAVQRLPLDRQHGHAVVADQQSSGRGRHGRNWYSPPGHNIYLSLGWNFQRPAVELTRLPLAVAVTVVRAMHRTGLCSAGIKWPNDIQIDGSKLAGILVEMYGTGDQQARAVIGIGVNVRMPQGQASRMAIGQPWTDVCSHLVEAGDARLRNRLCSLLLDELLRGLATFESLGFDTFADDWARWDVLRGREVTVLGTDETVTGIAKGISNRGGLLVACLPGSAGAQTREFFAGDVSIRATD